MTAPVLELTGVSKTYGNRRALQGVSFRLSEGEAVGYLGPNGAGKTTTLRLLAGLSRPTEGSVRLLGHDPAKDPARALRSVGVLVETPGIVPFLTPHDLLEHVARLKGVTNRRQLDAVAERWSFADHLHRPMGTLSTGLTRRVLLGAALLGDPDVVLLDEPTLGLDPVGRADLRHLLRSVRQEGRTLLVSTHLLDDVEEVCDRVLFLRDGVLVGDEPVDISAVASAVAGRRRVEVEFSRDVEPAIWSGILREGESFVSTAPRRWMVDLAGGDERQTELLGSLVRAGAPLLSALRAQPDLARRYMERIGREDGG